VAEEVVCAISIGDGYPLDLWPYPHESVAEWWSVGDGLGVNVFHEGHCPLVREDDPRKVM